MKPTHSKEPALSSSPVSSEVSGKIQKLSSQVVDQIAAGEVVERPANLLKELIENAVDAGATEIEVDVAEGGREVSVSDNGHGISADDLSRALDRHATSKIQKASDLWAIRSFGFRGEALASIASVSELSLVSRTRDSQQAHRLRSEFGHRHEIETVGGSPGTTIEVSKLFQNVPARLKFLKGEAGEIGQIKQVFRALGLSHFGLSMRLKVRGKLVFYWPEAGSLLERSQQILEKNSLHCVRGEYEGITSEIVFSSPQDTFGTRRNIWLFVQDRWVQDRSLQAAVTEAYRGLLMHGEFPFVVVNLQCDPQVVDVNIHPTKSQVKFQNPQAAFRAIQRVLRGELEKAPWISQVLTDTLEKEPVHEVAEDLNMKFDQREFHRAQYAQKKTFSSQVLSPTQPYFDTTPAMTPSSSEGARETVPSHPSGVVENLATEGLQQRWADLQVLAQADNTYIVAQNEKKLIFIDQHAAHERVAYEKLMAAWNGRESEVQQFLLPLSIELPEDQVEAVLASLPELERAGLVVDQGGPSTLLVHSAPVILREKGIVKAIQKLAEEVSQQGDSFSLESSIAEICATMACHTVIRAGKVLSHEEMRALLEEMDQFPLSSFCPHGRPVFVEYPFARLERDFGRTL